METQDSRNSFNANIYAKSWVKLDLALASKECLEPGFTQPLRDTFTMLGLLMCVILLSQMRSKGAINLSRYSRSTQGGKGISD